MIADVNRDDSFVFDDEIKRDSIAQIDRNRMNAFQVSRERMQAKAGVMWVDGKQF